MAGKARVHELARELGVSSKQVLSKLQDLGAVVKSPSSTVEAPVARQLRDAMIGKGQPGPPRKTWPHNAGNNPYTPSTPSAARPPAAPPRQRTSEPRTPPPPGTPPPPPMTVRPKADDNEFAADLARAQAKSAKSKPTGRRSPKMPPLAAFIAEHTGRGGFHDPLNAEIATSWAMQWHSFGWEHRDAVPWMQAGLNGNEAAAAVAMHRAGWTPATLRRTLRGETVFDVWRKGVLSIEDIDRMLREQDGDGAR